MANLSIKKILEVRERYMYSMRIYRIGNTGYIQIYNPFLRSPYPRHLCSINVKYSYLQKILPDYCL